MDLRSGRGSISDFQEIAASRDLSIRTCRGGQDLSVARKWLAGAAQLSFLKAPSNSALQPNGPYDRDLFNTLRTWRREEAQERGVPPYVIFSDRTLRELARTRPTTLYELRGIYGIGDAKLEAFGAAVIARIAEHGT